MNPKRIFFLFCLFFVKALSNAQTSDNNIYNLFLQKQYEKVIAMVKQADSLSITNLYYAGLCAEQLEDALLSVSYLQKCIVLDSTFTPAKISLAQVLYSNEEFTQATEIYANLLETDSLNAFLWNSLGNCYVKLSFTPMAYSCYRNAFYLNPKNSSNTLKLISVLNILKLEDHYEESLFYCDSSLSYNPTYKPLLRRKASLFFSNKEYAKADSMFAYLMSQRDSSFAVIKQAGVCKAMLGNYDDAIFLLRKAEQQSENDMAVLLYLASALSSKAKYFDESVEVVSKIRKNLEPDSNILRQTFTILAQSYLGIKDTVNAILQYHSSMSPDNKDNRLLRMTSLANNVKPETSQTLLWYVHYYFLRNFAAKYENDSNFVQQRNFSQFLLSNYMDYMHLAGKKKVSWQTFDKKTKSVTMDDLRKLMK